MNNSSKKLLRIYNYTLINITGQSSFLCSASIFLGGTGSYLTSSRVIAILIFFVFHLYFLGGTDSYLTLSMVIAICSTCSSFFLKVVYVYILYITCIYKNLYIQVKKMVEQAEQRNKLPIFPHLSVYLSLIFVPRPFF